MFEMKRSRAISALFLAFVLGSLGGCGGSVGGNGSVADTTQVQPTKEIFVSDKVLEPPFTISSHGSNLYVGSQYGLIEIDPMTGAKRTVAGNQLFMNESGATQVGPIPRGLFDATSSTAFVPLNPYIDGKMAGVTLSPSFTAPEIVIPHRAMHVMNFMGMTANATRAFWMDFDGRTTMNVYSQAFGQAATNQRIASVAADVGSMATSGDFLYLYTDMTYTPTRMIYRYQISTGNLSAIQQARAPTSGNLTLAAASNGVYWGEGGIIYFLGNNSNVAIQVGSVAGTVSQLTVAGPYLYSLHWEVTAISEIVVTRFDPTTLTQTEMVRQTGLYAQIGGTETGRIFLAKGVGISVSVSEITGSNSVIQLCNLPAYGVSGMYAGTNALAIVAVPVGTTYSQIYRYNYSSTVTDQINPVVRANYLQGAGDTLFYSDYPGNEGIMKLQLNMPINNPIALQPSSAVNSSWTQGGTSAGGYLYWVGANSSMTGWTYALARAMPNGSNFSVLVQTSGELRDPTIFNGRVYFLCQDSCGAPGWVIASTTLIGTGQQTEAIVGGVNPRLYQFNGHAYLTASDGWQSSIIALDMNTWSWSYMASQLPYTTLYLDFSNKWLYWSGEAVNGNGTPMREVARQAWIDWNHVSTKQEIVWGSGPGIVDYLRVSTLHYFAGNLYYWNQGLVRVPE